LNYCLNCGSEVIGKYCHDCGQKVNVNRLSAKVLLEEIGHFFTHIEHYFLHTTKEFIIRPGKNSLDYLKGKRKKYQKPVSFFLVWTGLYILGHNLVINYFDYHISYTGGLFQPQQEKANELLRSNFTFFFIPVIFVSSVIIWLVLARPRLYYTEVLTLCLYGAGCFNAMLIIVDLVFGIIFRVNINDTPVFFLQTWISAAYNFWFCYNLFSKLQLRDLWWRLILTAILISVSGWAIIVYLPVLWFSMFA